MCWCVGCLSPVRWLLVIYAACAALAAWGVVSSHLLWAFDDDTASRWAFCTMVGVGIDAVLLQPLAIGVRVAVRTRRQRAEHERANAVAVMQRL